MAIPFYVPRESEASEASVTSSSTNSPTDNSRASHPIDNEVLVSVMVQAFHEFFDRCSQGNFT